MLCYVCYNDIKAFIVKKIQQSETTETIKWTVKNKIKYSLSYDRYNRCNLSKHGERV